MTTTTTTTTSAATPVRAYPYTTRDDWLADRPNFVGASEVACIIGASGAYSSGRKVWEKKLGTLPEEPASLRMRMGQVFEPGIGQLFSEEAAKDGLVFAHQAEAGHLDLADGSELELAGFAEVCFGLADDPRMRCTPDGWVRALGSDASDRSSWSVGQIKNVASDKTIFWVDGPPPHILAQVQAEMHCTGLDSAYVIAALGGGDIKWWRVERDQEAIDGMVLFVRRFWEYVESGTPWPDVDARDLKWLPKRFRPDPGSRLELSPQLRDDAREWRIADAEAKAAEKRAKAAKARLIAAAEGKSELLVNGEVVATYREDSAGKVAFRAKGGQRSAEAVLGIETNQDGAAA